MTDQLSASRDGATGKFIPSKAADTTAKRSAKNRDMDGERIADDESLPESELDGRTKAARRFRRLVRAFEQDLGGNLSHAERSLIRSAAALTLRAEQCQTDLLSGKPVSDEDLVRLTHASARILNTLRQQTKRTSVSSTRDAVEQFIRSQEATDK